MVRGMSMEHFAKKDYQAQREVAPNHDPCHTTYDCRMVEVSCHVMALMGCLKMS